MRPGKTVRVRYTGDSARVGVLVVGQSPDGSRIRLYVTTGTRVIDLDPAACSRLVDAILAAYVDVVDTRSPGGQDAPRSHRTRNSKGHP